MEREAALTGRQRGASGESGGCKPLRIARPRSLATLVTDQIRDLIVDGRLPPGGQLSESMLAEKLGTSRTPVREAFGKLEAEGLVEVRPQRGTFVVAFDPGEVRQTCELRGILEVGALQIGCERDRTGLCAALRANVDAAAAAVGPPVENYHPFDTAFHDLIVRSGGNDQLNEAYARVAGRVRRLRFHFIRTLEKIQGSQRDHLAIVEHLEAGRDEAALATLRHHVHLAHRGFLEALEQPGPATG
ncbi:GntR family transcriptional regulator [Geminicoccus roseus]|uniref:GntR family transcriptional regulator n=1 Tax=Geminicoccus roseus TaxID=404900 RepID=UPI0003FC8742|nr:GntR family transcriptional regulator [Geminicoccus roseus]